MSIWNAKELRLLRSLSSPFKIQAHLDSLKYNVDHVTRSPREVMRSRTAHCFDGALFGAAALETLGFPPLLIDLRSNGYDDDDHVLAVFKRRGLWGALGKSNYTGCRFRDPVYRSLRELVMSYFHIYFNLAGKKTLVDYSVTFDLRRVTEVAWRTTADDLTPLGARLDALRHFQLVPNRVRRELPRIDERTFKCETLFLDPRGAFNIRGRRL